MWIMHNIIITDKLFLDPKIYFWLLESINFDFVAGIQI